MPDLLFLSILKPFFFRLSPEHVFILDFRRRGKWGKGRERGAQVGCLPHAAHPGQNQQHRHGPHWDQTCSLLACGTALQRTEKPRPALSFYLRPQLNSLHSPASRYPRLQRIFPTQKCETFGNASVEYRGKPGCVICQQIKAPACLQPHYLTNGGHYGWLELRLIILTRCTCWRLWQSCFACALTKLDRCPLSSGFWKLIYSFQVGFLNFLCPLWYFL